MIYHFFYGALLDAEVAMAIDVKDREMFDIFYNTSCGKEPQVCDERWNQRIRKHLVANRRGDVRNHTERACFSLPYSSFDLEPVPKTGLGKLSRASANAVSGCDRIM